MYQALIRKYYDIFKNNKNFHHFLDIKLTRLSENKILKFIIYCEKI